MIPNYILNSGWTNHSCMVISHKMIESEIEYRGSKSVLFNIVKEQRVDGNYWINLIQLRYTLMDFLKNYQLKYLSKQLNNLFYSTDKNIKLNPYFVTGLIDAEGCFSTTIYKNIKLKTGWRVQSFFEIGLNQKDSFLLYQLQEYFGGIGSIRLDKKSNALKYSVSNIKNLINIIIPLFQKYSLLTQKRADFILFKQIVELMNKGNHLTINGIQQIINLKASMNLGLSDLIKSEFSTINPIQRPIINSTTILDPHWISGFVSGDGNFDAGIRYYKNKEKIGYKLYLRFRITQHEKDIKLLKLIIIYLGAGRIEKNIKTSVVNLVISKFLDINEKIIPFFNKYPIYGIKHLDYLDWCKISNLINLNTHRTIIGLEEIRKIKSGMNKNRK